jgi:hypothetical protein
MDWQLVLVVPVVAAAGLYLLRRTWRTWAGQGGCAKGCCGAPAKETPAGRPGQVSFIPSDQLTLLHRDSR